MPKVVNPDILEASSRPDTLPRLLNADEMSVSAFGWQNVGAAFLARQLGERAKRRRPEWHRFGSGFWTPSSWTTMLCESGPARVVALLLG